jgi:hypothetical protein
MRRPLVLALAAALTSSACDLSALLDPSFVGPALVITTTGDTTHIVAPDTVARAATFQLQFFTFGSCRTVEASRTDVRIVAADTVEVRPFDREGSFPCGGDVLKLLPHAVSVTFNTAGRGVIRIVGEGGALRDGARAPAVVERTVIVR